MTKFATFDSIIEPMSPKAIEWLAGTLGDAAYREHEAYIDPEFRDVQDEIVMALERLAVLVDTKWERV